jgi:hypothetical protein
MRDLQVGQARYAVQGSDCEIALAHAIGSGFIELQQLEFMIISYLDILTNGGVSEGGSSFELFASKTFGNLLREMRKHPTLTDLADEMQVTKERRDFFTHQFLFHRYGGELFTTEADYELLVCDACDLGNLFAKSRKRFDDLMLKTAPIAMIAGQTDADTGETIIVETEHALDRKR